MPKIMVVEDDAAWQRIIRSQLSGLQGIVDTVTAGEDALSRFDEAARLKEPYDACVLDTMFPKKGGNLPDYSAPLELIIEFVNKRKFPPQRVFVVGSVAPYIKEEMTKLDLNNFYFKEESGKQPYQKHWSRLRADLSQSLRR